ncbi:MAG: glycosyltransferase [Candidatus Chisholmbacteria bacterium]|nr:glycosyltransferase [Candidatus Chisholmbacteria bacterium]
MHSKYDLSLILACYNEMEIFADSVKKIIDILDKTSMTYEIIFIDDHSQDHTVHLIKQTLKKYSAKNLRAFFHSKNLGRGKTVSEGFLKAQGKIVGYIDIDLEIPSWYIPRFVESIKGDIDGAIGWRIYDLNFKGLIRWIFSKSYMWLRQELLNLNIKDTEAGYKFFKRDKIIPIVKKCQDNHWFWDTEIVARSLKADLKLTEIPVVFIRRVDKTSTVRLLPDTIDYFYKLFSYQKELKIRS